MQTARATLRVPKPSISTEETRRALRELIKERSFSRGTYKLATGRTSDYYLDMKPTMFHPAGAFWLAQLMLERIRNFKLHIDYVGGLAMGAVPLVGNLCLLSYEQGYPLPGFFVRDKVKEHGTKRKVEGTFENLAGKNVVILDDVTTTGQSAMYAVEAARAEKANVVLVLSVVDRIEGATECFAKQRIAFEWLYTAKDFF